MKHSRTATPSVNGHGSGVPLATVTSGSNGAVPVNGRAASGRFAEGNKFSAGNPFARAVAVRRKALLDAVSPEDIAKVGRKLCSLALDGDVAAAKVLLSYVVGKTTAAPDPDRLDLDELGQLAEAPDIPTLLRAFHRIAPALATVLVREGQASDEKGYMQMIRDQIVKLENQLRGTLGSLEGITLGDEDLDDEASN